MHRQVRLRLSVIISASVVSRYIYSLYINRTLDGLQCVKRFKEPTLIYVHASTITQESKLSFRVISSLKTIFETNDKTISDFTFIYTWKQNKISKIWNSQWDTASFFFSMNVSYRSQGQVRNPSGYTVAGMHSYARLRNSLKQIFH